MTRSRGILRSKVPWSQHELFLLRELYADQLTSDIAALLGCTVARLYNKAMSLGLSKSPEFLASRVCKRLDGQMGAAFRFKPGLVPWNKGQKGIRYPGAVATQFKAGHAPLNRQEVGTLRINSDGQLDIKIAPGMRQWKQLSHYQWFLETGYWPPKGHCLRFRNGDTHDPRIENLELVTRRENMLRNSLHTIYPPEVARLVQLRGAITRQINRRSSAPTEASTA